MPLRWAFRSPPAPSGDPGRPPGGATTQPQVVYLHRQPVGQNRPKAVQGAPVADRVADEGVGGGCLFSIRHR
jgi:hypothetical protein